MTLRPLFVTQIYEATLAGDRGFAEFNAELDDACRMLADEDEAGQAWCVEHGYGGYTSYASLDDLPVTPDLVEVFRKSSDAPEVVADAARVGARTVWLQLGIWNEDAARQAEAAGLEVVMDRCVKIEHARFHGGLNLAGFVTGVISSRRQELDR